MTRRGVDDPRAEPRAAPHAAGARAADTGPAPGQRLVTGTLMQAAAQGTGLLVLLAVVTLLARRLSLAELGVYGLVATLSGSLLVLRNSVASTTVRALAAAPDAGARRAAFSTALVLYAGVGAVTGLLVALAGQAIAFALLSGELARDARLGAVALGLGLAVGLTTTIYLDALRGSLLFSRAAALEIASLLAYLAGMLVAIAAGAPLWLLIAGNAAIPLVSGLLSAGLVRGARLPYRFSRSAVSRGELATLLPAAGYLLVIEVSTVLVTGLDRVIIGAFETPAAVGLYEGPVRAFNLFWALGGALAVTVLPTTARLLGERDRTRVRELALRGSRYTLALVVPLAVTLMALAAPLLEVWLGERFRAGATALTLLVSPWLVLGALAVTPGFLVGAGRERPLAVLMALVAASNVALSVALTPLVGIEGPALGTAIPYALAFPFLLRLALSSARVSLADFAREAWLPAYALGAILAAALVALRELVSLDSAAALLAVAGGGVALYWIAFVVLCLRGHERALMWGVARAAVGRRAPA